MIPLYNDPFGKTGKSNPFIKADKALGKKLGLISGRTGKKEKGRDSRRSFNRTQQNEIWDNQHGKCAGSHCKHSRLLRSATHYDHIIPHEKGGRTEVSNGQALCATCHSIKTNKDRLEKVDKKRKPRNNPIFGGSFNSIKFNV